MKNKVFTIILFLFVFINVSYAQDYKSEITKSQTEYLALLSNQEMEKAIEFIYPKLFEFFPKDFMLQVMEQQLADTTQTMTYSNNKIVKISKLIKYKNAEYAKVKYTFTLTMQQHNFEDEDGELSDLMISMFEGMYGENNVKFDKETSTFIINSISNLYAVRDENFVDKWTFLEDNQKMQELLKELIPQKVMKKFKKF